MFMFVHFYFVNDIKSFTSILHLRINMNKYRMYKNIDSILSQL